MAQHMAHVVIRLAFLEVNMVSFKHRGLMFMFLFCLFHALPIRYNTKNVWWGGGGCQWGFWGWCPRFFVVGGPPSMCQLRSGAPLPPQLVCSLFGLSSINKFTRANPSYGATEARNYCIFTVERLFGLGSSSVSL